MQLNMADDVYRAFRFFQENLEKEVHIAKSIEREKLVQTCIESGYVKKLLKGLTNVYRECKEAAENFAGFMMSFFSVCGEKYPEFILPSSDSEDMLAMYNYCVHCVFSAGQIDNLENNEHNAPGVTSQTALSLDASVPKLKEHKPETERGLMCLGGGTLGEIWKVNKRLRFSESLTVKQKEKAAKLYRLSLMIRMSAEDKLIEDLAPSMVERDSGGMFIPKVEFLPFIRSAVDAVMEFANENRYKKYGKNLLKVCTAEVQSRVDFFALFKEGCKYIEIDKTVYNDGIMEEFFNVWLRKLVHARLGEFIRAKVQKDTEKKGKRSKGGQNLRDTLYALTSKKKSGTLSKCKAKKEQSKPRQQRKKSCETAIDRETGDAIRESPPTERNVTATNRVRREILKPRKLSDFICDQA